MWKNEQMSDSLKKKQVIRSKKQAIRSLAHFWWATWANRSWSLLFGEQPERWVTRAIPSHRSLKKSEWVNRSFFVTYKKRNKKYDSQNFLSKPIICSFFMSKLLTVAHLSWATWAIHSRSLICPERSEWIGHSCSIDLSDLSERANEQ